MSDYIKLDCTRCKTIHSMMVKANGYCKCPSCLKEYKINTLVEKMKIKFKYPCLYCKRKFDSEEELTEHFEKQICSNTEFKKQLEKIWNKCDYCEETKVYSDTDSNLCKKHLEISASIVKDKYKQTSTIHCPDNNCEKGMLLESPCKHELLCSNCGKFWLETTELKMVKK